MKSSGHRKNIIRNTLWGNANIGIRYLSSFIATAIIAKNYSPEDFGFYQLVLTYAGILEAINLLHPTHIRNHLVDNPNDEAILSSIWCFQSIGTWLVTSIIMFAMALFSNDSYFWWLLLLANTRFLFRAFDYIQFIADFRLRNEITQRIQIFSIGFFNLIRIIFSSLSLPLSALVGSASLQGLATTVYQIFENRRLGFKFKKKFDWLKFIKLAKEGGLLTSIWFVASLQSRIVSTLAAEKMSAATFGNFQLILKLVEPATAIGMIVLTTNYTVLTHTLKKDPNIFIKRFSKIAAISISAALACGIAISIFPKNILFLIFGDAYQQAINAIWMGALVIVGSAILAISTNLDTLLKNYKFVVLKYLMIFLSYIFLISYNHNLTMQNGLIIQGLVPIVVVLCVDILRKILSKLTED